MMDVFESVQALFDSDWYRGQGTAFEGDAFEHFTSFGWGAGRDPHPLFNISFYLEQLERAGIVLESATNPLEHFVEFGAAEGLSPHPLFATAYYAKNNPDVIEAGMNPLLHYLQFGAKERSRRPHPGFDPQIYANRRGLSSEINPLIDYVVRMNRVLARPYVIPDDPDVSVIVLNFNKAHMTVECVVELLDAYGALGEVEIVVVDNGSDAADFAILTQLLPRAVRVVRLSVNRFFGEGNNLGVEASRGRYVMMLNNDAFVDAETIRLLRNVLETFPDAGAVGPRFIYPDGRIQEAGATISSCGTVVQRGKFLEEAPPWLMRVEAVDYVSAACVMLRRTAFDEIGGFDLAWDPAYYEDVDLCLKLELIGQRTYYCPDAAVIHIENATSSNPALRLGNIVAVNREKFLARWGPYLAHARDVSRLPVALPQTLREPRGRDGVAVLFTPYPLVPGGGERYVLGVASLLSQRYRTYLLTPERYSSYRLRALAAELDLDLSEVRLDHVSALPRYADCDVFVAMGNEALPPIRPVGKRRVFICQFPFPMSGSHVANAYEWLAEYQDVVVYSSFVAEHFAARSRQFADRTPPVTVIAPGCPQYTGDALARVPGRILNVGRFTRDGHCKRQDELVLAFRTLVERTGRDDLELHLVGIVPADAAARDYFERVRGLARGLHVQLHVSAPAATVRSMFETASYYWHATGLGNSEQLFPERQEHFGIVVVEAMSAGAIPLVYDTAGPATIVRDGVTGYHWHTREELVKAQMQALALEPASRARMIADTVADARSFDDNAFREKWRRLLDGPDAVAAAAWRDAGRVAVPNAVGQVRS